MRLIWEMRELRLRADQPKVTRLFRDEQKREIGQSDPRPRPSPPLLLFSSASSLTGVLLGRGVVPSSLLCAKA